MTEIPRAGDHITASVTSSTGQIAIGKDIQQAQAPATAPLDAAERAELARIFAEARATVAEEAPAERRAAAIERVDELEAAVSGEEPDLTTIEYVRAWFARVLPSIAGSVTSVLVHPLVGRVVQAAGESLTEG